MWNKTQRVKNIAIEYFAIIFPSFEQGFIRSIFIQANNSVVE